MVAQPMELGVESCPNLVGVSQPMESRFLSFRSSGEDVHIVKVAWAALLPAAFLISSTRQHLPDFLPAAR